MNRRRFALQFMGLMLLGSLAACASAPQGPPPFDPVGTYMYEASADGMVVSGEVMITGTEGAYGGQITSDMLPPIPISDVTVAGTTVTIAAATPEGDLMVEMLFDGTAFTGSWTMAGMGGDFTGRRVN